MRLSRYFLPVLRETPKEAEIASHQLMLRCGMIKQASAGIYSWLPLGLRALRKIENIVREEQNRAGAIELLMPTIQSADLWRESGRYDDYGKEMLRIQDRHERDMLFGPTNEEQITQIFRDSVRSYKELPRNLYHIQWKFRDEIRPRFGVMRGREFLMKGRLLLRPVGGSRPPCLQPYVRGLPQDIRNGWGLKSIPMAADTGPIGGDMSHEFIILADTGESQVFGHKDLLEGDIPPADTDFDSDLSPIVKRWTSMYAATRRDARPGPFRQGSAERQTGFRPRNRSRPYFLLRDQVRRATGLSGAGTRRGHDHELQMGSYGVGISRLVGAIIEACHDDAGITWPVPVAPFEVGIINLKAGAAETGCGLRNAL